MALVDIILSEEQSEGTKAVLSQWLFSEGDWVEKNQPILEIETDKVMMEVIAPETGKLAKIILQSGQDVTPNTAMGQIETDATAETIEITQTPDPTTQSSFQAPKEQSIKQHSGTLISPSVRRLINQHNIDIHQIKGTGKNNRITSRDIDNYLKTQTTQSSKNSSSSEHLPISNMRRSIAKHMVQSLLHTAPHVTSVFNLDLSAIIAHRKQNKAAFKEQGAGLTFTSYFIAACVKAIQTQPLINSQLHQDTIEVFKHINIGIGTALNDEGLIVPVLKNCENKDLLAIAKELTRLTNKARSNKLKPSDVQEGTFTISNHGVSGSLMATPIIINQPQSAILGIGKMEKRVVVKEFEGEDVMVIKPMCYVTLTIDHRVLDAQQCNQFLSVFVETLENWQCI
jgi:2-oxoglutarate dehydrogenase E2 component (dihydrolipoamide succinyltransferase)